MSNCHLHLYKKKSSSTRWNVLHLIANRSRNQKQFFKYSVFKKKAVLRGQLARPLELSTKVATHWAAISPCVDARDVVIEAETDANRVTSFWTCLGENGDPAPPPRTHSLQAQCVGVSSSHLHIQQGADTRVFTPSRRRWGRLTEIESRRKWRLGHIETDTKTQRKQAWITTLKLNIVNN